MNVKNKKIILTGASGGIGSKTALYLAKEGAQLVLVGRNKLALGSVFDSLQYNGLDHQIVIADLSSPFGRQAVVDASENADCLINMAGINSLSLLESMSDEHVNDIINSNLTVPILLTKALLPILASRPKAAIVNVGSILGSIGMPGSVAYCASKFGLSGFTESLKRELSDTSIKVSYVAPRATQTGMNNKQANELNNALGNNVDTPDLVAKIIIKSLKKSKPTRRYIGWPEAFFVRINALFPRLVDRSFVKKLHIIKKYSNK